MYYYVQNNASHVWFLQSTSIQHLTVCVANSPCLRNGHTHGSGFVHRCAHSQLIFIDYNFCVGSGVRLFQAQFCAYAMLINETPELTLCFSYGKHGMCGMTGSNVMEAVAKAAIIFYSNINKITYFDRVACCSASLPYVICYHTYVKCWSIQEMWCKKAWLTMMRWGCYFRFPDGTVRVTCLCPLVFLHMRLF